MKKMLLTIKENIQNHRSIRELNMLTDRELQDIGIGRCDIERVVINGK